MQTEVRIFNYEHFHGKHFSYFIFKVNLSFLYLQEYVDEDSAYLHVDLHEDLRGIVNIFK